MKALDRPAVTWAVAGAYALVGSYFVFGRVIAHDEGLSTYFFARYVGDDFLPAFFCQKFKPVVALVYAPIARMGLRAFLLAHVLVGAAGVLAAARAARRLGTGMSNLVAAIVASSPVYLLGGPLGLSNVDGVVALSLVLCLYAGDPDAPGWALLLGALPWVRYELAPFVATLLVWDVATRRRWTTLACAAAFPVAYLLAGAAYHRDVLWAIHFPPSAPPQAANPLWSSIRAEGSLAHFAIRIGLVTPFGAAALFAPWRSLRGVERAAAAFAVVYLLALNVLPSFRVLNFDYSPRYSLEALPVLALLVARAAGRWRRISWSPRAAIAVVCAVTVASPALMWSRLRDYGYGPSPALEQAADWLGAHAQLVSGKRVYTDVGALASYLRMRGIDGLDVRYLEGDDQAYELAVLTDPANGQRAAVARLVASTFYAPPDPLATARAEDLPLGTLFVVSEDLRLHRRLSADVRRHLRVLSSWRGVRVASLEREPPASGDGALDDGSPDAPSSPEVAALLDGLHAGDALGSWTVERVHGARDHQLRIDVRAGDRALPIFVASIDHAPPDPPRVTTRYCVFYGSPRPPAEAIRTEQVDDALGALAERIRRNEARVPVPVGL